MIQIQITDEQWKKLNDMKQRGETFVDVLDRLLKIKEELKGSEKDPDALH